MFLQLFSLVLCVSYACSTCLDSGDIDIKGLCFKFVAQQMTFNDARNWCHYQNPVISSYLAYVPDQYTSNFLASYARTAFRSANGIFWIGLSRNNISSWVWDNGNPVTYTNFGTQLGQNYVAESSANSKWSTFGENDKNFFVCSYDPAAPPTFRPPIVTTTQVPITEDTSCKPIGSLTYLFAFSNDLDPQVVKDSWNNFHVGGIAIARFDVRDEEDIVYFTDFKNATAYLLDHLPNSKLGFGDTMTGSSSLRTIEKFYNSKEIPVCGAVCMVFSKR
ncbi:C-type lectin domain-containing protein [Caenorhabditis elegans]|uniref:C-type lectin domain-containing protein n=1 Tax=Caenorhabditis elegans TaxID=6239 RepID=A4F315_CAEEL|nr:C-type lectin domain-containing protein [Caenorhabditis elegans]CCD63954.1 C-type lectin domain-containing protein [Caenorhabditis elegans]|eukprot:NP_741305.1 C-type LECtin [Caenorhabditis elegans]